MEILVITSQLTSSMCNDLKTLQKENYETVFPDYLPKISPTAGFNLKIILSMPWNCVSVLCRVLNSWNMHIPFPYEDSDKWFTNELLLLKLKTQYLLLFIEWLILNSWNIHMSHKDTDRRYSHSQNDFHALYNYLEKNARKQKWWHGNDTFSSNSHHTKISQILNSSCLNEECLFPVLVWLRL